MTLNPDATEPLRVEYYVSKLLISQDIRGRDRSYDDLKHTYQISLLVNDPVFKDEEFAHRFEYYDKEAGISLNGRTHIITLELSKLEHVACKPVEEMTATERWAVFFRYTSDKKKRELVNEIIKMEGGIAMAGQVLLTISKDQEERIRLISEEKNILDYQSGMTNARRAGLKEGEKRADIKWQNVVADKDAEIADKDAEIADKDAEIADKDAEIADKDAVIADKDAEIAELKKQLGEK